jgi:hypothetical protein
MQKHYFIIIIIIIGSITGFDRPNFVFRWLRAYALFLQKHDLSSRISNVVKIRSLIPELQNADK